MYLNVTIVDFFLRLIVIVNITSVYTSYTLLHHVPHMFNSFLVLIYSLSHLLEITKRVHQGRRQVHRRN